MRCLQLLLFIPLVLAQTTTTFQKPKSRDTVAMFGIPYELFRCGTGGFVTNTIIDKINETCPLAAVDFNHCCAVHDDCYDNQRGRDLCDNHLCACMAHHVASDPEAEKCGQWTVYACGLVKDYGENFYGNSGAGGMSGIIPEEQLRVPEEVPQIAEEYQGLYEKCETQNATLMSCALNTDLCLRNPPTPSKPREKCLLNLLHCLDDTKNHRELDKECDVAIEKVLWKLVAKTEEDEGQEGSGGGGGDVNVLMVQEILQNKTFVQRVYLQIIRRTSSFSWIFYACVFSSILLCCVIVIIGITRCDNGAPEYYDDEVINVHISQTSSRIGSPESEAMTSSEKKTSEKKSSKSNSKKKTSSKKGKKKNGGKKSSKK